MTSKTTGRYSENVIKIIDLNNCMNGLKYNYSNQIIEIVRIID